MEWVDGWKPFPLQIEDSTGFLLRIVNPPQIGRVEDLRKEFLWNLQSSIFKCKQGIANSYQGIKKSR